MADCQDDGLDDNEKEQAQIDLVRYKSKQAEKPKKAKAAAKPKKADKADKAPGFQAPALTLVPVGSIAATPQVAAKKAAAKTTLPVASSIPKPAKRNAKPLQVPGKQASMLTFFNKSAAAKAEEDPEARAEAGNAASKTESDKSLQVVE